MEINTAKGNYQYAPIPLYYGRKLIDKQKAKNNLLCFKKILDENGVLFCIVYGTLLGAIREKDFISHDEDVDTLVLDEDRERFLTLLFRFREVGFDVARYENDLLSLIRDDDYIDVYFFKKSIGGRRCNKDRLPNRFFTRFDEVKFLGEIFYAPNDSIGFLEYAYGKTWQIPQINKPAEVKSIYVKFKVGVRSFLPRSLVHIVNKILGK